MIRAVFLDVGGIFHLPAEDRLQAALAEVGFTLPPGVVSRAHYAGMIGHDRRDGEYEQLMEPYVEEMVRDLGVPAGQESGARRAVLAALLQPGAWSGHLDESVQMLPALAATGVRLAIVSNADGTVEARLRDEAICQVGPGPYVEVDVVVDSTVVGIRKPDPRIWEAALAATRCAPENAVHVGDSLITDVAGARAAGITPIHFDPFHLCSMTDHRHAAAMADVVRLVRDSL